MQGGKQLRESPPATEAFSQPTLSPSFLPALASGENLKASTDQKKPTIAGALGIWAKGLLPPKCPHP